MPTYTNASNLKPQILAASQDAHPFVIAVDGYAGSGKSTLAKHLAGLLGDTLIVQIDDFIIHPHAPNTFDHDWEALEQKVFKRVRQDEQITVKTYDWNTQSAVPEVKANVGKYVIVDGIGLLNPKYANYFDLKMWVDCPFDVAMERGKRRDKEEQGVDHDELWDTVWGPGMQDYYDKVRPDLAADILYKTN